MALARGWVAHNAGALAPSTVVARTLGIRHGRLAEQADAAVGALFLLDDELSRAGEHAEGLLAEAARVLTPAGPLLAGARNRVHAAATGADLGGLRGFSAVELERAAGQRGFAVDFLVAPGAAAALRGAGAAVADLDPLDRSKGLLDAAPRTVVVARRARDAAAASEAFFASLPRKVAAASVLCRDPTGRVLVVHDSFRGHWTIPGGVVDADEDPRSAAVREAWEEAGLRVVAGGLLGVFSASWPDRIVFVYAATGAGRPTPRHAHEVDAAEWVTLNQALERVAPYVRDQITRCLNSPGGTWRQ